MSRLLVTRVPDPILTQKAHEIPIITQEIFELAQNMTQTMHESNGVGLAAPQ
ncbi:peptide deformylase, partial [Candidatus Falkowbacteria bacterium]|nr:peptide deformylase [Candidatus Falkowbacteria bacterium]